MATLNKASYEAKYNDAGTGIFKAGQSRGIGSEDARSLVEDEADSLLFREDDFIDEDSFASDSATKVPSQQSTKKYVDDTVAAATLGIVNSWKTPVALASTADLTLSGEQTIDGVLTSASRVLVKDQSTGSQNGIYVTAAGAWTRSTDMDVTAEFNGAAVTVLLGSSNANTTWVQTSDNVTVGSTAVVWTQLGTSVPDADATTKGIARLYPSTSLGTNTDGAPTQNAAKAYADAKVADAINDGTTTVAPSQNAVFDALAAEVIARDAAISAALSAAKSMIIAVTDEVTNIGTGTAQVSFRMPYAMTLTAVRASLVTAQASGSIFTVDINEAGVSILSTKLTIDNTELTSVTAATPPVISDAALADDALITVDVDQIGNGTAVGLKITLIGS